MNCFRKEERHMRLVTREALNTDYVAGARVAALVVLGDEVISTGYNLKKTNPFAARFSKNQEAIFLHAETHAIRKALNLISQSRLRKSTLYVARVRKLQIDGRSKVKSDVFGSARPCQGCMGAIEDFGIKKVFFSLNGTEQIDHTVSVSDNFEILER